MLLGAAPGCPATYVWKSGGGTPSQYAAAVVVSKVVSGPVAAAAAAVVVSVSIAAAVQEIYHQDQGFSVSGRRPDHEPRRGEPSWPRRKKLRVGTWITS